MANVDQFESIFRASFKERLQYRETRIRSIVLITDLDERQTEALQQRVASFLSVLNRFGKVDYVPVPGNQYRSAEDLLRLLDGLAVDLICTYRNLHSGAWRYPHSLGEHLDVLIQQTEPPVLILPHPKAGYMADHAMTDTRDVMVVSDLVAINHDLVNYAAAFTEPDGILFLSHVESERIFTRYMDAIAKIDVIDTELARRRLAEQLLKEPEEYFASCAAILAEHDVRLDVRSMVRFGVCLDEYRHQIESRKLDLLVMHARDELQQAMNSVAYPLAVELRQIPLLMI